MFISSTCYTIKKLSLTIISERVNIWLIYYYTIFATTTLFRLFELFRLFGLFLGFQHYFKVTDVP